MPKIRSAAAKALDLDDSLALVFADVVQRADIGVIESGDGARLALEAFHQQLCGTASNAAFQV